MTIRDIAIKIGYDVDDKSYKEAMNSISKLASTAKKILGVVATGAILNKAKAEIESYMKINNQLAYATDYLVDMAELQEKIQTAAQNSNTSYNSMANAIKSMAQDTNTWKLSIDDAAKISTVLGRVFRGAGLSREESGGLVEEFARNFQNGRLTNLTHMIEQAPELINYLAKSLNMTVQGVKALASKGAISLKQFTGAILDNVDDIDFRYSKVALTITDSLAYVKEKFFLWLSTDGQKTVNKIALKIKEFGDRLGPLLTKVSNVIDRLGGLPAVLTRIAAAAATIKLFSAGIEFFSMFDKYKSFFTTIGTKIGGLFGKTAAGGAAGASGASNSLGAIMGSVGKISWIAAVIYLAIRTIVELVKFVLGVESAANDAYERRGQNADRKRAEFIEQLTEIKNSVMKVWDTIKSLYNQISQTFGSTLETAIVTTIDFFKILVPIIKIIASFVKYYLSLFSLAAASMKVITVVLQKILEFASKILTSVFGKLLEKVAYGIEKIVDFITWIFDGLSSLFNWSDKGTSEKIEDKTMAAQTSAQYSTITIIMDNNYTFNGSDRNNQTKASKTMDQSAEDVVEKLTAALSYGG